MYNLLEYSDNYSMTSGSLWNYYRNEINYSANENSNKDSYRINSNNTTSSKPFEYKTKIIGRTPTDNNILKAEVVVPLKHWSNFWRSLDLLLLNCETELDLSCSRYCVVFEMLRTTAVAGNPPVAATATSARFRINNAKLYVLVVTLSINNNIKFSENIKQGFKRTIS